jgi:hypothetical protein|tara:strand:+ start:52 stop:501 length:450 start_codon:yes stop_codon:yes gene_type:complete
MPYVGRDLSIGDRHILTPTGTTPATSFTLQNASVDYYPSAAQNLIVSVGGVIQAPITSYTISGATIDFLGVSVAAANIDFIVAMGQNVDVGTPSDGTISAAKLSSTFYTENPITYSNISITASSNGMAAGPITVTGTLTIPSGSTFTVV